MQQSFHPSGAALLSQVLGLLREDHADSVDQHLRRCRPCIRRATQLKHDAAQLAFALQPVEPPPMLRDTLLQAAGEIHRLYPRVRMMAKLLQIDKHEAHALLDRLDAPSFWQRCGSLWLLPVAVGKKQQDPSVDQDLAYFVRISSGSTLSALDLPYSLGGRLELVIVQGNGTDQGGKLLRTGQHKRGITELLVTATVGCDLIVLVCPAAGTQAERRSERDAGLLPRAAARLSKQADPGSTLI